MELTAFAWRTIPSEPSGTTCLLSKTKPSPSEVLSKYIAGTVHRVPVWIRGRLTHADLLFGLGSFPAAKIARDLSDVDLRHDAKKRTSRNSKGPVKASLLDLVHRSMGQTLHEEPQIASVYLVPCGGCQSGYEHLYQNHHSNDPVVQAGA